MRQVRLIDRQDRQAERMTDRKTDILKNQFADGTSLLDDDGGKLDMNLVTWWSGYRLTRNFSTGYLFKPITRGCYYRDEVVDKWSSYGLDVCFFQINFIT